MVQVPRRAIAIAFTLIGLVACRDDFTASPHAAEVSRPLAQAGTGGTVLTGATVMLDGSASRPGRDPIAAYEWSLIRRPAPSSAVVPDPHTQVAVLTVDVPGQYIAELTVTDTGGHRTASQVSYTAVPHAITVSAGVDRTVPWRQLVTLAGTVAVEANVPVQLEWTLTSRPTNSLAMLSAATTTMPALVPDVEGTYVVRLTARTGDNVAVDDVTVMATALRRALDSVMIAAEYSRPLESIIATSESPARLNRIDPVGGLDSSIALAISPLSLAVSPDGLEAAIGGDHVVVVVDLLTMTLTATYPVPLVVSHLTVSPGTVHCFPDSSGDSRIYSVDRTDGSVHWSDAFGTATAARFDPGGTRLYAALSGSLWRFDPTTIPVTSVRRSTRDCYGLSFTEDGGSILCGSGAVLVASDTAGLDMTSRGHLDGFIGGRWITHSAAAGEIATVYGYDDNSSPLPAQLELYSDSTYALLERVFLPETPVNGVTYVSAPTFVAFSASGTEVYVLAATHGVQSLFTVVR